MSANTVRTSIRNYKVLLRGINSLSWTAEEKIHLSPLDIKPDKLIRILGSKNASEYLDLSYSENHDLLSNKFDKAVITKLIVLLTKMAFITGEVDTRTSIDEVWDEIISVIPELNVALPDDNEPPKKSNGCVGNDTNRGTGRSNGGTPPPTSGGDNDAGATQAPPAGKGRTDGASVAGTGGKKNMPYFFDGLQFGHLSPENPSTHGVVRVCMETKKFSSKKLVADFPIAAAFLTRSLIEQAIIYYAKTHNVQAQTKLIWEQVCSGKRELHLSDIIKSFNKNLPNYIADQKIKDYFTTLFKDYNTTANPLNWVVHRPDEFVLHSQTLIELPGNGLLSVINYLLI